LLQCLNELMCVLKEQNLNVPKDCRTLKTPTDAIVKAMDDGFYMHYGVEDALTDFLTENKYGQS